MLSAPAAPHDNAASFGPQTQTPVASGGSAPFELAITAGDALICDAIVIELDGRLGRSAWTGEPLETGPEKRVQIQLDRHHWKDLALRVTRHVAGQGLAYFDRHDLLLIQRWQLATLKWACAHPADVDHRQARLRHFTRFGCALESLLRSRGLSTEIRVTAAPPAAI